MKIYVAADILKVYMQAIDIDIGRDNLTGGEVSKKESLTDTHKVKAAQWTSSVYLISIYTGENY